jgi:transcriptional regulator with XRE-family HTH domain
MGAPRFPRGQKSFEELAIVVAQVPVALATMRRAKGLALVAAARRIGISTNTIRRIEAGENYNVDHLVAVLAWLGATTWPTAE